MATTCLPLTLRLLFGDPHVETPKGLRRLLVVRGGIMAPAGATPRVCGWCQRVATGPSGWHEVEDAVRLLPGFDVTRLTRAMCADCFLELTREMPRLRVVRRQA
jgi:hypothetical protein